MGIACEMPRRLEAVAPRVYFLRLAFGFMSQTGRANSVSLTNRSPKKGCPIHVGLIVLRRIYFSSLALFAGGMLLAGPR